MTTEIQHDGIASDGPSRSGLSAAKCALIGTIISTTAGLAIAVGGWVFDDSQPPPPIILSGTEIQTSPDGSVGEVTKNESGSELTVSGWAAPGVNDVVVLVGPRPSDKKYWVASASVTDEHWEAVVKTDPQVTSDSKIKAYFNREIRPAAVVKPLNFIPPTPSPAPPPNPTDITQCAALYGESCFTNPAWGPPAIYQPNA